jgi:hypothetical protein
VHCALPHPRPLGRPLLLCLAAGLICSAASAAQPSVPYVPTPQAVVDRMLEIAKVTEKDYLIDLGSGDGRIVITAARKYGARGFGVDLNPERVAEANRNAEKAGVSARATFYERDLFATDLSPATVITMYLLPRVNLELRPKLLELKPGTRLVSHDFSMGDWRPDRREEISVEAKYGGEPGSSIIYFWHVPAKAAGTWRWALPVAGKAQAYQMTLEQKFQDISGEVRVGGRPVRLRDAKLLGDQLNFSFTAEVNGAPLKHEFSGRIEGDAIEGNVRVAGSRIQAQLAWNAQRFTVPPRAAAGTGFNQPSRMN